jgi:AraC-like DNA-binding protein
MVPILIFWLVVVCQPSVASNEVLVPSELPPELRQALVVALSPGIRQHHEPADSLVTMLSEMRVNQSAEIQAWSSLGLALLMIRAGSTVEGVTELQGAETWFRSTHTELGMVYSNVARGYAAYEEGRFSEAYTYLSEARSCFEQSDHGSMALWMKADLVRLALDLENPLTAAKVLDEYDQLDTLEPVAPRKLDVEISRARLLAFQGGEKSAVTILEKALEDAKTLGHRSAEAEICLLLTDLYMATDQQAKSKDAFSAYLQVKPFERVPRQHATSRMVLSSVKAMVAKPSLAPTSNQMWLMLLLPITTILILLSAAGVYWIRHRSVSPPISAQPAGVTLVEEVEAGTEPDLGYDKLRQLHARIVDLFEQDAVYRMPRLTLSDVSYRLGTNDKYVSQAINACTGDSFIHFVNEYRIRHARQMLVKSGRRVSSRRVAVESGFGSVSSFHRVFKTYTGLTPVEWMRDPVARRSESMFESSAV